MNRRTLLLLVILSVATVYTYLRWEDFFEPGYLHHKKVPETNFYRFPDIKGPMEKSTIPQPINISWRNYHINAPSAFAIFLTDTASDWIGLVHGLKNIGIPVFVTNNVQEAIQHKTVLAYPLISGKVLSKDELQLLASIPRNGGNLIGVNVYGGGLNEVFGFDSVISGNTRNELLMTSNENFVAATNDFNLPQERNIRLTNSVDYPDEMPTNGYVNARTPLISYKEDNTAFLCFKDYGEGKAYAFGLDLGNYFLRYMNERGFNAYRTYANQYDPGMDVMLRILKNIYRGSNDAVTLGTVPFNKDFSLVLTHDVDYTKSILNAVTYARMEKELGVKATYFIQTKYIKDWNDDIFFTQATIGYLNSIRQMGMEIASHSISHSRVFSKFELGTGAEYYPRYSPFVQEQLITYNGSIMGELRVSKFLLEKLVSNVNVVSFRPGHLQYPFALPQALTAANYKYSSSVTSNNVQTHLPYIQMYNRGFSAETEIVEIPITIEDELGLPMLQRLDSTIAISRALSAYGGVMNVLIHTDTLGSKLEFERRLLVAVKDKAWVGTIQELGYWWHARNQIMMSVEKKGSLFEVTIENPSGQAVEGITLQIPLSWVPQEQTQNCTFYKGSTVINKLTKGITLQFKSSL